MRSATAPGAAAVDNLARHWSGQWAALTQGEKLQSEIRRLREVEGAALLYSQTLKGLQRELFQLRKLNDLPDFGKTRINARIIGYFPPQNRFTLSVGSEDGVTVGLPVVNGEGLVGIVQTVEPHRSQALLTSSPVVKIGGMVLREPEVLGIVKGQTPVRLILDVLDNGQVEVGDPVVTSGLSSRIPRGIAIGTVVEVVPDPSSGTRRVFVSPSAQIGSALEVSILK